MMSGVIGISRSFIREVDKYGIAGPDWPLNEFELSIATARGCIVKSSKSVLISLDNKCLPHDDSFRMCVAQKLLFAINDEPDREKWFSSHMKQGD